MPDVRGVKVDGLLYKPQAKGFGVEVNILLRITSNSGYVMNPVWINAQDAPLLAGLVVMLKSSGSTFISLLFRIALSHLR